MSDSNLYAFFHRRFPADGAAMFLQADRRSVTYGQIDDESGRYLALLQQCGVVKGDRVIVQVEKSVEAVLLYLACLRAGAIFIPLNTGYTAAEVDYFVADATPRLLVCSPDAMAELSEIAEARGVSQVLSLAADGTGNLVDRLDGLPAVQSTAVCRGDDLAAILYTSGTTGRAKGAMITHDNLATNAAVLHRYWHWQPGDVLLHALPIFHVHGLFVALHCALMNGSEVIFLDKFDIDRVIAELPRSTVMMGVPTFYVRLLEDGRFGRDCCDHMRLFISGSAPLLAETFADFEQRTGKSILERYGMTEAGMITSNPYDGERIAGTVGFALPDIAARVADDRGRELAAGEVGVLEISGPNVFAGYWQMPEKTAEEFRDDGYFITGDMATMAADGRISIVGRAKDLIISGGYNVYPKEIEQHIDELPGVKESAVIGLAHADFGEAVTAIIVADGTTAVNETAIKAQLAGKLAKFKQPKKTVIVPELPRNAMGKVQKKELRDTYADLYRTAK